MSAEPDFDQIYRLLGVGPEQGWGAVRQAYRQRAQTLHPDKVTGEARLVSEARQRFEQLNAGYRLLKRYRGIFGELPPRGISAGAGARKRPRPKAAAPSAAPVPRRRRRRGRWLILVLPSVAVLVWYLFEAIDVSRFGFAEDRDPPPSRATPVRQRFTLGSSIGEVLDVQGQPDRVEGQVWHYGGSTIVFERGRVASWQVGADGSLAVEDGPVEHWPDNRRSAPRQFFDLGSSKSEVIGIQGAPLSASDLEWDYGVSKVYFEHDRVMGWFNSPLDPLRVHGPYGLRGPIDKDSSTQ